MDVGNFHGGRRTAAEGISQIRWRKIFSPRGPDTSNANYGAKGDGRKIAQSNIYGILVEKSGFSVFFFGQNGKKVANIFSLV
jgi:hypothetical protein